jgi:hypothetical protein
MLSEWIAVTKDILVAIAAIIAAVVAIAGLNVWRREHRGKIEYEFARRLFRAAKRVQNGFAHVRNPYMIPVNSKSENDSSDDPLPCIVDRHNNPGKFEKEVYSQRLGVLSEAMADLESEALEAQALGWQLETQEAVKKLRGCMSKLYSAINDCILDRSCAVPYEGRENKRKEYGPIIASTSDDAETNPLTREIDSAIDKIENMVRSYLKR